MTVYQKLFFQKMMMRDNINIVCFSYGFSVCYYARVRSWTLSCVLGQDTLLSRCFSTPRIVNVYQQTVRGA